MTKFAMYGELMNIHRRFGCAILFVTHDFTEAQKLAGRVGVMDGGQLKAVRPSDRLFDVYQDVNVNKFFGIGEDISDDMAGTDAEAEGRVPRNH